MTKQQPGMDPRLEAPEHWQGFHNGFIAHLQAELNTSLPGGYRAVIEQRLTILPDDQLRRADVAVIRVPAANPGSGAAPALLDRGAPHGIVGALFEEVFDWYIEIRTTRGPGRRVVAVIELLSPSNKASGSQSRREYQQKQRELIHSETHLVEIDLLKFGAHTVAAPLESLPPQTEWDYLISAHRGTRRFQFEYWLNRAGEPLPEVRIPLLDGDADTIVDLEQVFNKTYTEGRFDEEFDAPGVDIT